VARPLHLDPDPLPACDALVLESTYGDRLHPPDPLDGNVCAAFRKVIARAGTILIPAFAVARAQMVTLQLKDWMAAGDLPQVPVHIDSPMAVDVTQIYQRYLGTPELDVVPGGLFPPGTKLHRSVVQSRELNALQGPRIIISSSGMLTGGRVLHHLERLLPDRKNMLVLVGYQAAGTRGRRLMEGERTIRMHGRDIPANAELLVLDGFSAHADRDGLVEWANSGPAKPQDVFLVHGEPKAQTALRGVLESSGMRVTVPGRGDRYERLEDSWSRRGY
jgi:metallo-beta-lactamase family protein